MTFCGYWSQCKDGADCPRALTVEVMAAAAKWWGGPDAPIFEYAGTPTCFKKQ